MNTRKQVILMVVLLMVGLLGIAAYSAWDPTRNDEAAEHFNEKTAIRGSLLFARNCRTCHGDVGEGGAIGGRLTAAPTLDRPDLQGFVDVDTTLSGPVTARATEIQVNDAARLQAGQTILVDDERMEVKRVDGRTLTVKRATGHAEAQGHASGADVLLLDPAILKEKSRLITNTITCGRVGKAMPAWAQSQGGPLSDEQIRQLMVLITEDWWFEVEHEVDIEDEIAAGLTRDIDENTISLPVSDVTQFNEGEALRIGEERMLITGVPTVDARDPDKSGIIQVERGALGTDPLPHSPEDEVFRFPLAPDEPAIVQQSCGQTAVPPQPSLPPGEKACADPCQTVDIIASGVQFNTDELIVTTGGNVRIHFTNNDNGVQHNVAVYTSSSNLTAVAPGSIGSTFPGVAIDDVVFAKPAAGTYFFRCDVHPTTMTGDFIVR